MVLLLTFALALASSLYAAQRAAALDPVEAMRPMSVAVRAARPDQDLPGRRPAGRGAARGSTSRSSRGRWWRSSAPRGRASRRCCICSGRSTGRTRGAVEVGGQVARRPLGGRSWRRSATARSASSSSSTSSCPTSRRSRTSCCRAGSPAASRARCCERAARLLREVGLERAARSLPQPALRRRAAAGRPLPRAGAGAAAAARRRADRQPRPGERRDGLRAPARHAGPPPHHRRAGHPQPGDRRAVHADAAAGWWSATPVLKSGHRGLRPVGGGGNFARLSEA